MAVIIIIAMIITMSVYIMNSSQEKKVLKYLLKEKVITSSELARFLGVSWNTGEKYLLEMALDNKVIRIKKEGVNLWMGK